MIKKKISSNFFGNDKDERGYSSAKKFSKLVVDKVVRAPYVKGTNEFISRNYKRYSLYISSGTPINEMRKIVETEKAAIMTVRCAFQLPRAMRTHPATRSTAAIPLRTALNVASHSYPINSVPRH